MRTIKKIVFVVLLAALGIAVVQSHLFQTIAAGVAIFLFGMLFMEEGFRALTGGILKKLLALSTNTILKSQFLGFTATAVMQSSSLVTVITISTITAGLISLTAGMAIIFGANIGTTTGAWLMAGFGLKVDIARFAMPMIVLGLVLMFQKNKETKGLGNVLAGVGFVFLGIHYIKDGFDVVRQSFDLSAYALTGMTGLVVYTLLGVVATVIMQSSHATLMITIAALAHNQISYDNALAVAIGSNIGTTVTAVIGSFGANAAGKRLAWAHVLFNLITGAIAIVFIVPFKFIVDFMADSLRIAEDNWTLRLAAFHTIFNVMGVIIMTPAIPRLVRLLERRIQEPKLAEEQGIVLEPQFLNEQALALPDTALNVLRRETWHMFDNVFEVVTHGLNLHRTDVLSDRDLSAVVASSNEIMDIDVTDRYYRSVKTLYSAIVDFATRTLAQAHINTDQVVRVQSIRLACRDAAEIVKLLGQIRPNLNRFMQSDNPAMREQYNLIRLTLAQCLRALYSIRDEKDPGKVAARLQSLRNHLAERDALSNGTIDRLVRDGAITPAMATSLMNDSAAATSIGNTLAAIGQHIILHHIPRESP